MTVATGGAVERRGPQHVQLIHNDSGVIVDGYPIPAHPLGLTAEQATKQGQAFATFLRIMTGALRPPAGGNPAGADPASRLLTFSPNDPVQADRLDSLRTLGQGLWDSINPNLLTDIQSALHGKTEEDGLPPQLLARHPRTQPSFPWEMLYEPEDDPNAPTDWRRFWGFRYPIARWPAKNRHGRIQLNKASLSVACESLPYSRQEVSRVWQTLSLRAPHLRHDYLSALIARQYEPTATLPAEPVGIDDCLCRLVGDQTHTPNRAKGLLDKLYATFHSDVWNLYHFACHAEANSLSQMLSELQFTIGGCQLSLSVGRLLARKDIHSNALVFLNACSTAEAADTIEPPELPLAWIERLGAFAVVATVCPVPDAFAHHFALAFYGYLVGKDPDGRDTPPRSLASALVEARRHFMERYNNPLGLAYTLYANENNDLDRRGWE